MAAADYHLDLAPIEGESKDEKYSKQIQVNSFNWGVTNQASGHAGGGSGTGKCVFSDISFTKPVDKASAKLMLACATGEHLKKAVLHVRKAGGKQEEYYTVTLSDCLVSSFQSSGHAGGDSLPSDSFSLNFSKVEFKYSEQANTGSGSGTATAGYDLKANKKL